MKTTIILLFLSGIGFSQNLSLTGNISLGYNCGNGTHQTFTYQDVNLNGYKITLRNASLIVNGNINGGGEIDKCGNQNNSFVCINGAIQNNPNLNGITCTTLETENFVLNNDNLGIEYKIYNLLGKCLRSGKTNLNMYDSLDSNTVYIVKVENYKPFKIIK